MIPLLKSSRFWTRAVPMLLVTMALLGLWSHTGADPFPVAPNAPVFAVEGRAFWRGQPAARANIYLHPLADRSPSRWPNGFPRATVNDDGTFTVSTFAAGDGAPVGRYAVLVRWANKWDSSRVADDDSRQLDRFSGRYLNPARPACIVEVGNPGPTSVRITLTD